MIFEHNFTRRFKTITNFGCYLSTAAISLGTSDATLSITTPVVPLGWPSTRARSFTEGRCTDPHALFDYGVVIDEVIFLVGVDVDVHLAFVLIDKIFERGLVIVVVVLDYDDGTVGDGGKDQGGEECEFHDC